MRGTLHLVAAASLMVLVACSRDAVPLDAGGSSTASTLPSSDPWMVTWAAAAQTPIPGSAESFEDAQPVRLIIHTSAGGDRVRVRFSNRFGTTPLPITTARIALRTRGAEIDPASERTLTFKTSPRVLLAPGQAKLSDAIDFAVPAFADLAITFWMAGDQTANTTHVLAQ